MDRILDSGSNDWGSTPHGDTKKRGINLAFLFLCICVFVILCDSSSRELPILRNGVMHQIHLFSKKGICFQDRSSGRKQRKVHCGSYPCTHWGEEGVFQLISVASQKAIAFSIAFFFFSVFRKNFENLLTA